MTNKYLIYKIFLFLYIITTNLICRGLKGRIKAKIFTFDQLFQAYEKDAFAQVIFFISLYPFIFKRPQLYILKMP